MLAKTLARGHHVAALALPLAVVVLGGCDAGRALPASGAAPLTLPSAERGRLAITRYPCGSCHLIPGVPGAGGRVGPTLEHFGRRSYIAGEIPNDASALQRWLQDPPAMVPGTAMPDMAVPADVAADMAAYLMSLR